MKPTTQMSTGEFSKYKRRGAYHWDQIRPNLFCEYAILSAHYERHIMKGRPWVGKLVLDIGCGDGALTGLLAKEKAKVIGVDLSYLGIQLAMQEFAKISIEPDLANAEGTRLPFSDNSFDVVVMSEVIEHLQTPERTLAEIVRIITPNGRLLLSTPLRMTEEFSDEHFHEYFPNELNRVLKRYFRNVIVESYNPSWLVELYSPIWKTKISKIPRVLVNLLSSLKRNPFLIDIPSRYYISQTADCRKPIKEPFFD